MFNDVYEIIGNCKVCARFKGPKDMTKVPLKMFQEGVLQGRWHVDTCGPISPKSREGYEYILVAVEAFSGWPVVVPLYKQTADEIAKALITHVFSLFGAPQSILTDQGKAFDSLLFLEIMELYQIKNYRTTAFHPAANGKAERWIKTL
ncbi:Gag-Pol polyprotein [Frankliniella fusca]|uniref:Gag-Pol polyprotein n=1 Tax=Frankliniella fusca TaxID=407009 RepID=A0AAE1H1J9_9NEOP|nr:Gag-Pol polyprotein [Frankliniella fusca]